MKIETVEVTTTSYHLVLSEAELAHFHQMATDVVRCRQSHTLAGPSIAREYNKFLTEALAVEY